MVVKDVIAKSTIIVAEVKQDISAKRLDLACRRAVIPKTYGIARKLFDQLFWLPFVKFLASPKFRELGVRWFTASEHMKEIRDHAGQYLALELMYTYDPKKNGNGLRDKLLTRFWELCLFNTRAVRYRIEIVEQQIGEMISELNQNPIRIVSVASGSARGILEVLTEQLNGKKIEVILLDHMREPLNFSLELAKQLKVNGVSIVRGLAQKIQKCLNHDLVGKIDIVEIVGLLDYLTDEQVVAVLKSANQIMKPGAKMITANITPNPEMSFVTYVSNWPMIYRTKNELLKLIGQSGLRLVKTLNDPLKIYNLVVVEKALPCP